MSIYAIMVGKYLYLVSEIGLKYTILRYNMENNNISVIDDMDEINKQIELNNYDYNKITDKRLLLQIYHDILYNMCENKISCNNKGG